MPFLGYDFFYIKGTLKLILFNLFRALLRLFNFKSFFSFFSNIIILNTPFTYFAVFNLILIPITPNYYIY